MAAKKKRSAKSKMKVVLIQSEQKPTAKVLGVDPTKLQNVEVWVRTPDSERLEEIQVAARLCACRRVCLAVIEDI